MQNKIIIFKLAELVIVLEKSKKKCWGVLGLLLVCGADHTDEVGIFKYLKLSFLTAVAEDVSVDLCRNFLNHQQSSSPHPSKPVEKK